LNKLFRIIILLFFLGAAIVSVLLVIKPGASIFHYKHYVNNEEVTTHNGFAYRYPFSLNSLIFQPEGGLLYEDGQLLDRTFTAEVVEKGLGKYSLVDQEDGSYFLNFSAGDNSNPLTNGKNYTLFIKVAFLSRTMGTIILGILSLGLAWFIIYALKPINRKRVSQNFPLEIWQLLDDFLVQEVSQVLSPITNTETVTEFRRTLWIDLLTISAGTAYFYVFMEWFFFVTKPSFMDLMSWVGKFELFLLSSFALALLSIVLIMILAGVDFLISHFRFTTLLIIVGTLIPSFILAAISLLLVDNFTYTIFNFGIVSSSGIWRSLYGITFILIVIYLNSFILNTLGLRGKSKPPLQISPFIHILIAGLLITSAVFALARFDNGNSGNTHEVNLIGLNNPLATRPNILIIGSDGLNATNLSLYGYERETTRVLRDLANTSLVANNAFTNSSTSTGSITSMLTGKPDAQTRVLYPPNILQGVDAYQHLPGMLRDEGYYTVEIAVPHYIDAYQVNMLDGFHTVNERSMVESELVLSARKLGFGINAYFASGLVDRITNRLLHISSMKEMENPYTSVTQPIGMKNDPERVQILINLIRESERPLFIHAHLMGTHGSKFYPTQSVFSKGKIQNGEWMTDFYDDSILTFDHYLGEVIKALEQTGKINNTILVIYSDHPMQYNARHRVPLVIHFPNDEFAGRIETNVQNLDIAPTILDYLGVSQPPWMVGKSLLGDDLPENRLIFSGGTPIAYRSQGRWVIDSSLVKPPFFQFTSFNVINCHRWYRLNLIDMVWDIGNVPGHTKPCAEDSLLSMDQIEDALANYLSTNDFEISTLP